MTALFDASRLAVIADRERVTFVRSGGVDVLTVGPLERDGRKPLDAGLGGIVAALSGSPRW